MVAAARDDEQKRAAFRVSLTQHRGEISSCLGVADQRGRFHCRVETIATHPDASGRSGGVALIRSDQHCCQRIRGTRAAHFLENIVVPGHSADRCKRLEMLAACIER